MEFKDLGEGRQLGCIRNKKLSPPVSSSPRLGLNLTKPDSKLQNKKRTQGPENDGLSPMKQLGNQKNPHAADAKIN